MLSVHSLQQASLPYGSTARHIRKVEGIAGIILHGPCVVFRFKLTPTTLQANCLKLLQSSAGPCEGPERVSL